MAGVRQTKTVMVTESIRERAISSWARTEVGKIFKVRCYPEDYNYYMVIDNEGNDTNRLLYRKDVKVL